jgi:hypothetical protein
MIQYSKDKLSPSFALFLTMVPLISLLRAAEKVKIFSLFFGGDNFNGFC